MLETYCKLNLEVLSTDLSKKDMAQTLVEIVQEELHPHTDVFRSGNHVQLLQDLKSLGKRVLENTYQSCTPIT